MSHWMVTLGCLAWCVSTSFCTRSLQFVAQSQYWKVTGAVEGAVLAGPPELPCPHAASPRASAPAPAAIAGAEMSRLRRDTDMLNSSLTFQVLDDQSTTGVSCAQRLPGGLPASATML